MTRLSLRWLVPGLVVVVLGALAAVAGVAVRDARADLLTGQQRLAQARGAAFAGDPKAAGAALADARAAFASGQDELSGPAVRVAGVTPMVGANLDTARGLAEAGERLSAAGAEIAEAVSGLDGGAEAFAPRDGAIPLEPLRAIAGPLRRAADQAAAADAIVAATPRDGLAGPLRDARAQAVRRTGQAADALEAGAALAEQLPGFLGADGPRRYLLGAQNPAELRGTGGLIGAFTVLTADAGRIQIGDFSTIGALTREAPDELPPPSEDFESRYGRFSSGIHGSNINMTPDTPTAATAIERLHEAATGEAVDGTILADPRMLKALLEVVGPTEVPEVGTLEADTVVEFVTRTQYEALEDAGRGRKALLGEAAGAVLRRFLADGGEDPVAAVRALGQAAADGRLQVHARDEATQEAFVTAGVDGALADPKGDYFAVVGNNAAANKLDTFLEQDVVYDVELRPDGSASGTLTVDLENAAPEGLNPTVAGPSPRVDDLAAGDNRTYWSVFCAPGCAVDAFRRGGEERPVTVETERGRPVFSTLVTLARGERERLAYDWQLDGAWSPDGGYRLVIDGQPTLADTTTTVRIHPPEGFRVRPASAGMTERDGAAVWTGSPSDQVVLEADVTAAGLDDPVQAAKRILNRPLVSSSTWE